MATLRASVQYNDYKGTAAADNADQSALFSWAIDQGIYSQDTEQVMGHRFYMGENYFSAHLIIKSRETGDVREVDVDLTRDEYLAKFKRLEIILVDDEVDIDADYPGVAD